MQQNVSSAPLVMYGDLAMQQPQMMPLMVPMPVSGGNQEMMYPWPPLQPPLPAQTPSLGRVHRVLYDPNRSSPPNNRRHSDMDALQPHSSKSEHHRLSLNLDTSPLSELVGLPPNSSPMHVSPAREPTEGFIPSNVDAYNQMVQQGYLDQQQAYNYYYAQLWNQQQLSPPGETQEGSNSSVPWLNLPSSNNTVGVKPGDQLYAVHTHTPQFGDELSVETGDLVRVDQVYADGWAYGANINKDGIVGIFPVSVVTPDVRNSASDISMEGSDAPLIT
ncbi:hypothetical protein HDV05_003663 [Chytridiales sp. JEL 0842]|nr:hypothetical protein HDV05_003663 [Chytridiales sp. JEL 0842]